MDGNKDVFLLLVFATGISVYFVKVAFGCLDCPVVMEPIENVGNYRFSMNFFWNCSLSSNQTLLGLQWWNDETRIAWNNKGNFTAAESHAGRVKSFGAFGITLYNISFNDSGYYKVDIVTTTNDVLYVTTSCQTIFVPELFLQLPTRCHTYTTTEKEPSNSPETGGSKSDTGLIFGIVIPIIVVTCIVVCLFAWYFRRQRRKHTDMGNTNISNEIELLNKW
ncbi:hypothetical protein CHS0354_035108 [Potamilus streckersoni]|uniref:Uncharacterized protein n=1 Tax=Potamilus streckersoni TaxID=2493646 RepID=A0AAE0RU09_9BIVA|nr:hypothetical protein CHS0354_035108 [Potamilus streckersoni]